MNLITAFFIGAAVGAMFGAAIVLSLRHQAQNVLNARARGF